MKRDSSSSKPPERREAVRRTNDQSLVSNTAFFEEILSTESVLILVLDRLGLPGLQPRLQQLTGVSALTPWAGSSEVPIRWRS
jgi:hypothetical protein